MAYDWKNFLEVAKALRDAGSEGSVRSGMSRAYYALYGYTLTIAVEIKAVTQQEIKNMYGAMHSELPKRLLLSDEVVLKEIAMELKTLRARRNDADYNANCAHFRDTGLLSDSILSVQEAFHKLEEL